MQRGWDAEESSMGHEEIEKQVKKATETQRIWQTKIFCFIHWRKAWFISKKLAKKKASSITSYWDATTITYLHSTTSTTSRWSQPPYYSIVWWSLSHQESVCRNITMIWCHSFSLIRHVLLTSRIIRIFCISWVDCRDTFYAVLCL